MTKNKGGLFSLDHLIRLEDLDSEFIFDLRYATTNNFTGQVIYKAPICVVNYETAVRLVEAKNQFKAEGYRVKIFDIYRPISAQRRMHQVYPDPNFVSIPPEEGKVEIPRPRHLNGMSVDLTLTDLEGRELPMPSGFDAFIPEASLSCPTLGEAERRNASYLKEVMENAGFAAYAYEWWHFDDAASTVQPYRDICLTEFKR